MTTEEKVAQLDKKVKRLEYINYIRFGILLLSLFGATAVIMAKIKKVAR